MITTHFKIGLRNITKNKGFFALNAGGLIIGLTAVILISLWVYSELSFNKDLKKPTLKERESLLTKFQIQQKKLQYKTKKISDKNLDKLIIPHPLMGKMTLREIIMWTAHHTEHHTETLKLLY